MASDKKKRIVGAGGGGSNPQPPQVADDNLSSTQFLTVIDAISEGEIEGLKDGYRSIFLDGTPLQNFDGTLNFKGFELDENGKASNLEIREGTQAQEYIQLGGQSAVEDEKIVGIEVKNGYPVTRTITDTQVDAVRLTFTVPQLQDVNDNGDVNGYHIELHIDVQYNDGQGFKRVITDKLDGRTGDPYKFDHKIQLTGAFPADIRVTRPNVNSTNPRTVDAWTWDSYTEIIDAKLRYPLTALVGMRLDASQFNSIPSRQYLIRGIKIQIPSNADVNATYGNLTYDGPWDGTWKAATWCSDPAWILWDLLTNRRYGFGDHITEAQLDKWAFFSASQYCAEFVNGEPRFSCNVNIQTQEEAFKLINDMCSVFRAMPYWSAGSLTIAQDKPDDWAYLFTLANVTEEGFRYESSSQKTRPTVVSVSYLDLNLRDIAYEFVEDKDGIERYGVIKKDVSAFACTSQAQAHRIGEWLLYSEKYESETVTFTTSIDAGVMVRPGQLIKIADPVKAGERRGGRITSATTTTVTVDDATGLTTANNPQLNVILSDGTVEQRAVSGISGNVITVSSAFSSAPNANSIWLYGTTNINTTTWRVLGISEQDQALYTVTALAYEGSKYGYIEQDFQLGVRDVTDLNVLADTPSGLNAKEYLYESGGVAKAKLLVSWLPVPGVTQYLVQWRYSEGNYKTSFVTTNELEIFDTAPGTYEINVFSLNISLLKSAEAATLTFTAAGKTALPEDPTGLNILPDPSGTAGNLSWNRAIALDVILGGKVLIRHSPLLTGATWSTAQRLVTAAAGGQTQKNVPLLEGTYFIKFEDDTGNRSANAASVTLDLPEIQPKKLVTTYAEDTARLLNIDEFPVLSTITQNIDSVSLAAFSGTMTNMEYDGALGALKITDTSIASGSTVATGEYEFYHTLNMGGVFDVNLSRYIKSGGFVEDDLWDSRTDNISTWSDIDGTIADNVDAVLYVRTTQTDPSGTPTWSAWKELSAALVRGWGFQFKLVATTELESQNIQIEKLQAIAQLQQRTELADDPQASGESIKTVTFANPFYTVPSVGITAYQLEPQDSHSIVNVTKTDFDIVFFNGGEPVSRNFTYTAVGYGKEIT